MKDSPSFDHRPDPELGAALRAALDPKPDQAAFVARVMARYDEALERSTVSAIEILAAWLGSDFVAATAALVAGPLAGSAFFAPAPLPETIDAAMAPAE